VIIPISILISAGHSADLWVVRGIAIGGVWPFLPPQNFNSDDVPAICFVILLHGFTPRLGVYVINVSRTFISYSKKCLYLCQVLTLFKTVVLLLIVVTGRAPRLSGIYD
jgi:hypothetical protein